LKYSVHLSPLELVKRQLDLYCPESHADISNYLQTGEYSTFERPAE
jgi:hypothetical protein